MEFEDALMLEKKLVLSGSRITLMNTRWAIISAKFLSTISSPRYWKEVYAAGKDGGYETAIQIKKEQQMDPKKLVDFFISAWSEFGWGIAKLEGMDLEKKQASLQFTETIGGPLLCGTIAGVFKAAFGEDVDAEESHGRFLVKKQ